jgi:hypothetical protein
LAIDYLLVLRGADLDGTQERQQAARSRETVLRRGSVMADGRRLARRPLKKQWLTESLVNAEDGVLTFVRRCGFKARPSSRFDLHQGAPKLRSGLSAPPTTRASTRGAHGSSEYR